jgi:hypothetical protein
VRAALAGAASLLLAAMAVPSGAESPSPAPEDRTTTLSISPAAGPDRTTVVLQGFSDCAVIDGHLLFTSYDGRADNLVVRSTSTRYDYSREKYPYTIRLTVPVSAAPGPARVYAEPFCGPPEEYPGSAVKPFRVERSGLSLRLSPRRLDRGDSLRVRARTCDGARGRLTVRVREAGEARDLQATLDSTGSAALSVPVGADGEVSLPFAATECRGSAYAGAVAYDVRAGSAAVSAGPTPTSSASRSAAPSTVPSTPASSQPTPSASSAPAASDRSKGGNGWLAVVGVAVVAVAAGALAVVLRRRLPAN